jgi:hypothetical protein
MSCKYLYICLMADVTDLRHFGCVPLNSYVLLTHVIRKVRFLNDLLNRGIVICLHKKLDLESSHYELLRIRNSNLICWVMKQFVMFY